MRASLIFIVLAACLALCAYGDTATCAVTITANIRAGATWYVGATHYQIYDIIVTNQGSCPLNYISVLIKAYETGGFLSEAWNYNISSGLFSGYGAAVGVGQTFLGAGFVLANASAPVMTPVRPGCPNTCYNATAPTTSAPTTATPTTATPTQPSTTTPTTPTPTHPSTTTPTTAAPTTVAPSSCRVSSILIRDNYSWMDTHGNSSVYRLTITNNGPCALKSFIFSASFLPGTLVSSWNMDVAVGGYLVTGYSTLAYGASYNSAGMVLANAPDNIAIITYATTCAC